MEGTSWRLTLAALAICAGLTLILASLDPGSGPEPIPLSPSLRSTPVSQPTRIPVVARATAASPSPSLPFVPTGRGTPTWVRNTKSILMDYYYPTPPQMPAMSGEHN